MKTAPIILDKNSLIQIVGSGEPRIDSRLIAKDLGTKHHSVIALVEKYKSDFQTFGKVLFEIEPLANSKTGQKERFAFLNEDQSYLLLAYSRNTARVRVLKVRLVKEFCQARRAINQHKNDYLPTYHSLHDRIKAAGGDRFHHINFNRLINKTLGIKTKDRDGVDMPDRSVIAVAQMMAMQSINQSGGDLKRAYQDLKGQLDGLLKTLPSSNQAQAAMVQL